MSKIHISNPKEIVGVAELFDFNKEVSSITIGYRLNEQFWGKGIAALSVEEMTDYLFRVIGINRVQAFVMPENIKSCNVLLRNGFIEEVIIRQGYIGKVKALLIWYYIRY